MEALLNSEHILFQGFKREWVESQLADLRAAYSDFDRLDQRLKTKHFIDQFLVTDIQSCGVLPLPDLEVNT